MSLNARNALRQMRGLSRKAVSGRQSAGFYHSCSRLLPSSERGWERRVSSDAVHCDTNVHGIACQHRAFKFDPAVPRIFHRRISNSAAPRFSRAYSTSVAENASEPPASAEEKEDTILAPISDPKELLNVEADKFFVFSEETKKKYLAEGLPKSVEKEFEACKTPFLYYRPLSADLLSKIIRTQAELSKANQQRSSSSQDENSDEKPREMHALPKRRHFLLEGPSGSGKSFALMTAVLWARANDWLVLFVPRASTWTNGGFYFKFRDSPFWDTPLQAVDILNGFLESNNHLLTKLPCKIKDHLELGEGPGTGLAKGDQEIEIGSNWTLSDLVQCGIQTPQCATSVVVRLRQELAAVTEVPVMVAIDEYNSWFSHSKYFEVIGLRGKRPIHAQELRMVSAFRSMEAPGMPLLSNGLFLTAFSESIAVGYIPQTPLPGIPKNAKYEIPRLSLDDTFKLFQFYKEKGAIKKMPSEGEIKRLYYLTNGNGIEIRKLSCLF